MNSNKHRRKRPLITLTTDFGLSDHYVGAMKGVIASICREATVVDISHSIPPQDIAAGAFTLFSSFHLFPAGTVHLVVVDPGVGSSRRALAVQTKNFYFVAPDNGVLDYSLSREPPEKVVELNNPRFFRKEMSQTFHGRDIFAPVAAHLARGVKLKALGSPVKDFTVRPLPEARRSQKGIRGEVIHIDRFGNLITNIEAKEIQESLARRVVFRIGNRRIRGLQSCYHDVRKGYPLALLGSSGFVELSLNEGNLARKLQAKRGDPVWMTFPER